MNTYYVCWLPPQNNKLMTCLLLVKIENVINDSKYSLCVLWKKKIISCGMNGNYAHTLTHTHYNCENGRYCV